MKHPLFLSLKNIVNKPGRSIILAFCISVITAIQVATAIIDTSITHTLEKGLSRLGADLMIVPKTSDKSVIRAYATGTLAMHYMPSDIQKKVKQFPFIEKVSPQLYIKALSNASCCAVWNVFLIGFEPETDFTVQTWLNKDIQALQPNDVLCGAGIALPIGAPIKFYGQNFRVAGTFEPGGLGMDFSIFIPLKAAYTMISESGQKAERKLDIQPDWISALLVKLKDPAQGGIPAWKAANEIRNAYPDISIVKPADITEKVKKNLSRMTTMSTSISYAVWPMCSLLIALIFAMIVRERQSEIGLLQALGASRIHIFTIVESEAALIALTGAVSGILYSWGAILLFSNTISQKLEIPAFSPLHAEILLIAGKSIFLSLIVSCLAAFVPALNATRLDPYEAIRR